MAYTVNDFIEKAQSLHGIDKYDYSKVLYVNKTTPVIITCKIHGDFNQKPDIHLQKKGCAACGKLSMIKKKSLSVEEFISKAKIIHGEKFDYSQTQPIITNKLRFNVICNKDDHGEFITDPHFHYKSGGCRKCWQERISVPKEVILKRLNELHKDKLQFDMSNYVNRFSKIPTICKEHGEILSSAESLLYGHGCHKCGLTLNKVGWEHTRWEAGGNKSRFFEGFKVYLIKCFIDNETFYKIGKTYTNVSKRFDKRFPYNWELISEREGSAIHMSNLEKELHKECKEFKYTPQIPFKGQFECFLYTPEVQQIFNTLSK